MKISSSRRIADTALTLPVFGFGSAHLGELYAKVDEAVSQATLKAAWGAGVRFYDTAPWYGRGLSEHRVGGFLRTQARGDFKITTKVGRTLKRPSHPKRFDRGPWVGGLNFEVHFDYSYDGIMRSYEQALQRLALDTVDALVIHDLDPAFHAPDPLARHENDLISTGMKALEELKASGDIQAIGMGINQKDSLSNLAQKVDLDFALVAMPYTLIDQDSLHAGMADCVKKGVSVIIGAPFASGILATGSGGGSKYNYGNASDEVRTKVRGIEAVCDAHGVSLQAAALQFPLAHPAVVSIIPGASRPDEVTQNVASLEATIPAAVWSDLKSQGLIHPDAPTPDQE
ncbi:MAG: aldo/keto reductase [Inquilinaceae bacterium]